MWRGICAGAILYCALATMLSTSLPVLDEESYLYIARQLQVSRPYDWPLPWHPWTDSYIYAHPPLFLYWVRAVWSGCGADIFWLKFFLGLPFRLLLGGVAGYFCFAFSKNPKNSFLLWLSAPIVLLVGARSLMPDLMVCSLGALAMALYLGSTRRWRWFGAGVMLGLACWTKYPALLLWIPVLYHQKKIHALWPLLLGFALVWGGGELWLYLLYDRMHLWVVLETATQIARSDFSERGIGLGLRIVVGAPLVLLLLQRRFWLVGCVLALIAYAFLPALSLLGIVISLVWLSVSLGACSMLLYKPQVFHMWSIAVILGVWATHNFASPRYLALAVLPIAILAGGLGRQRYVYALIGLSACLSGVIAYAEVQYAHGTHRAAQKIETATGFFTGEWTVRWSLRQKGLQPWRGERGGLVQAKQAAGGGSPRGLQLVGTYYGPRSLRVLLDRDRSVGYYSETLGYWPLGYQYGPVEELRVWKP